MPHRCLFFLEGLIAFSEFLHITYKKTTILIERLLGTHESMRQRRGSGLAATRHSVHPALLVFTATTAIHINERDK
jgi:hypothetical protein